MSPVRVHRVWVVNQPDQESAQMSAADDPNVGARAEVASTGEFVAMPGPAVTEAVSDAQRAATTPPSIEGSGGVRVASSAPAAAVAGSF